MNSHVSLTFSLKYLVNFSKSSNLVKRVELYMSNDVPLLVSARIPLIHESDIHFRFRMTSDKATLGITLRPRSEMIERRIILSVNKTCYYCVIYSR